MTGPKGHSCPECGAPKGPGNTPTCGCAQRASDALRETRTADAAAAEDFDPLRIRPYVDLNAPPHRTEPDPGTPARHPSEPTPGASTPHRPEPDGDRPDTGPLGPAPAADTTMPLPAADPERGPDRPGDWLSGPEGPGAVDGEPRRRPRPALLLSVAGALAALVAAAGFASGLFSHATPSRDGAAPQEVRESVPDARTSAPAPSASTHTASPPPRSASPSQSPSSSPSATPSSSASTTSPPSPSPTRSTEPTRTATPANTPAPAAPTPEPVLRPGDRGPEVTELELRLRQLNLYAGPVDADYTSEVEDAVRTYQWARGIRTDDLGVYGTATRTRLESETSEP
ncbi:peptidoglycan-binding protein [Streptomyces sp. NPDC051636]|uniref:peptidoglycan-binding protein n=1 Tax=Streptomyces sp. NPDC051636 TaxID=3365663 RepID=UPI0037A5BBAE